MTITTQLEGVSAFRELSFSRRLIEEMRFQSAHDLLSRIDGSLLSEHDQKAVQCLNGLAKAYSHWDNFRYAEVLEALNQLPGDDGLESRFRIGKDVIEKLSMLAADCAQNRISELTFADMMNNAIRRKREGSFDDAVARIYRALEMIAQWVLKRADVDTDDVDTRRVPPRDRVSFEAMRSVDDGKLRIGLRKSFELLTILRTPLGLRFEEHEELSHMLSYRRNSILAHGTTAMNGEECDNLLAAAKHLFSAEIPNFEELCHSLQFPWLRA